MRGVVEPRSLAVAITRARGPSCSRSYSVGTGRGRGDGFGKYGDTEESFFGGSYGHGVPLNSSSAGRGGPLKPNFAGRGGPLNPTLGAPEAASPSSGVQFGSSSAGRGFADTKQTQLSGTGNGLGSGPLLPNISLGRGSPLQRPTEDLVFSDRKPPPTMPSLGLGVGGFGRGKPAQNASPSEDLLSSERRGVLPKWSKWDEKLKKLDPREGASPAELRLLGDEEPTSVLRFPAVARESRQLDQGPQAKGWQSPPATGPPRASALFQQSPPPRSSGFEKGWQKPIQQPLYDARVQPQPPLRYPVPQTGWQQPSPMQSHYDTSGQPPPTFSTQQPSPPRPPVSQQMDWGHAATRQPTAPVYPTSVNAFTRTPASVTNIKGGTYDDAGLHTPPASAMGGSYYDGSRKAFTNPSESGIDEPYHYVERQGVPAGPAMQDSYYSTAYHTGEQQPDFTASAMELTQADSGMPYHEEPYLDNQETGQPAWMTSAPETTQQAHAGYQMGDWGYNSSSGATQEMVPPYDPSQYISESNQGKYLSDSGSMEAPPPASHITSEASDYDYDWGQATPEPSFDPNKLNPEAPLHAKAGLDYEGRIEECFKQGKLEDIDSIYNEMKAAQVRASAKTYDTLIQTYIQLKKMDKVPQVYQEMSGILFSNDKTQNVRPKETSTAMGDENSTMQEAGHAASEELSRSSHDTQDWDNKGKPEIGYEEEGGFTKLRDPAENNTSSVHPDTIAQGFSPFKGMEASAGLGMGRGKKVDSFFSFDFSQGSELGGGARYGRGHLQADQEVKPEMHDDYSQTFTPVIQPGWYAFAPEGVTVGPGAGRGRPLSPQALDLGSGSSMPFPSQQFDSGAGRGRSSYAQRMEAALRQAPPLYSRDVSAKPQYDYPQEPQEPSQPLLSKEEAGERAMKILNARLSRRYSRMEDWSREEDDDDRATIRRKSSDRMALARFPREKRQPKKPIEEEKTVQLTEEEAKKEAERLKAMEQNEAIEELQDTLTQFMKCYGEMALEPEHELGDFTNPDIDEKPIMPLEEFLEKAKPNIMKTGLVRSEEEWRKMVDEALRHAPYFEEFAEQYGGPGRYTAKQENEDLEEIASTLPSDVGPNAQAFVQRSLITLKSNPGYNLDEKQWMLATMVDELSQYPMKT